MKMYVWSDRFSYLAIAQADSVADARASMLVEMGESGDGSCPERDKARREVLEQQPSIWVGKNAEFALTDSAELREQEEWARGQIAAKDAALSTLRERVATLERQLAEAKELPTCIRTVMQRVKSDNERWWRDLDDGSPLARNVGEVLALIHSEISEALEGHRKNLMDDHLPHRKMFSVELADAVIRIMDAAAHWAEDMPEALEEKLEYNRIREDHKEESRRLANGKKY